MRRHRLVLLAAPLVVALGLSAAPASAADTLVAQLQRPSAIRGYAGIEVFSDFDGTAYRLAIVRDGKVEHLPVAPSQAPFDADIGPDRNGRPQLIYTRCGIARDSATGTSGLKGCDLFVFSLTGGTERPVRNANTDADEVAPTLWKGRIAFARGSLGGPAFEVGAHERAVVYTKELMAPRSRPSTRLPGIPRRGADRGRTTGGNVAELELSGEHLAEIVNFVGSPVESPQQTEVRLVDIADRSTRRLAHTSVGEGGQYFAGIGFADGHLAWAAEWVTGGGAVTPGIYRYRLSSGELSRAPRPRGLWWIVGLAPFDADGAYVIDAQPPADGCGDITGEPPVLERPCQLVRSEPLSFRPVQR